MLVLIHLFWKVSPIRFEKMVDGCLGCGNCSRLCPMDIRTVHEQKTEKDVLSEDCLLCLTCIESCPADDVLTVKLFKGRLFSSSRAYISRNFPKGAIHHE